MEKSPQSTNGRATSGNILLTRISAYAHSLAMVFGTLVGLDEQGVIDDIAQDVVLECLIKLRTGQWDVEPDYLRVYVRNAVRMRTVDYLRRSLHRDDRQAEHVREMWEGMHAWMEPDVAREERELSEFHARTLASLPEVCRKTYLMIRDGGASYAEVAERLGVTRSAVNANVVRAQSAFRARLLERGITPPRATKGAAKNRVGDRNGDQRSSR